MGYTLNILYIADQKHCMWCCQNWARCWILFQAEEDFLCIPYLIKHA